MKLGSKEQAQKGVAHTGGYGEEKGTWAQAGGAHSSWNKEKEEKGGRGEFLPMLGFEPTPSPFHTHALTNSTCTC